MKLLKLLTSFEPRAISDHPTDDVSDEETSKLRYRRILKNIRLFIFGTASEEMKLPTITSKDIMFVLITLNMNIRFLTNYIDMTLEWGGFFTWSLFSLCHISICPCLAFIHTFLGSYGNRSSLNVWDMLPVFQGMAGCMVFIEILKAVETCVILSSGLMTFKDFFRYANARTTPLPCNETFYLYKPARAVPFGWSKHYTDIGYSQGLLDISRWEYTSIRGKYCGLVWLTVIVLRIFQFKRYRIFPLRVIPVVICVMIAFLMFLSGVGNTKPVGVIIQYTISHYTSITPFLQVFVFSLSEFLPSHWVTIGYLGQNQSMLSKLWAITSLKILAGFFLLFWIPHVAADFRAYTNISSTNCLNFFGSHFVFVMIPLSISARITGYVNTLFYVVYFLAIMIYGSSYILVSLDLHAIALTQKRRVLFRYRNLICILICLLLYGLTLCFCIQGAHYMFYMLHVKAMYQTTIVLATLTTLCIALYGLERINGDYLFMHGIIYPNISAIKVLFLVNLMAALLFFPELITDNYRREDSHSFYITVLIILLLPFVYGVLTAMMKSKSRHGYFQPLSAWGMAQPTQRNERRRKTIRTMFTYRMKRDCIHNCLVGHPVLMQQIEVNRAELERLLGVKSQFNTKRRMVDSLVASHTK